MDTQASNLACQNPRCLQPRGSWLARWRRPKGIQLNKKWYCNPECFEQGAITEFSRINLRGKPNKPIRYRLPLGLLMLSKGFISRQNMERALKAQHESKKGRFGEWLLELGIVTEEQLTIALGMQWGCPVFHMYQKPSFNEWASMVPLHTMETARMVPVHFLPTSRTLYLAFSDGIDYSTLYSLEQMLDCRTQPCVISQSEMAETHDEIRRMHLPSETLLDCPRDTRDLARMVRGWAEANRAERVGAVACPGCWWVRIESQSLIGHLLFRFQEAQSQAKTLPALGVFSSSREPVYS